MFYTASCIEKHACPKSGSTQRMRRSTYGWCDPSLQQNLVRLSESYQCRGPNPALVLISRFQQNPTLLCLTNLLSSMRFEHELHDHMTKWCDTGMTRWWRSMQGVCCCLAFCQKRKTTYTRL